MVAWRSLHNPIQICPLLKQLNFSAYLTFGIAVIYSLTCSCNMMVDSSQGKCMRPKNPHYLVGQSITLCCLNLVSSDDIIELKDVSFECPKIDALMSEIYKAQDKNKICINATMRSTYKGFCECTNHKNKRKASQMLIVDEPPSLAEKNFSCLFYDGSLTCLWKPQKFLTTLYLEVELLYQATHDCRSDSAEYTVSCQNDPPCNIINISEVQCCYYYNISLRMNYSTSGGLVTSVLPRQEYYLPGITKYPPLSVKVKEKNETCITLEWTHLKAASDSDSILFEYTSQWEPNKVETSNFTIEWPNHQSSTCLVGPFSKPYPPEREKTLCGLTPFTWYEIEVMIRPSTSYIWSDPAIVNERTKDSVPARPPPIISGAFKRISSSSAIIYWKLLSAKEWQSDETMGTYHLFTWNYTTEEWQLLRSSLSWRDSQSEIRLFEEQDAIIKLQAHNHNGYSVNYSKITIPFKGPPTPSSVTAVMYEAEKQVKFSWESDFNEEAVLFWCLEEKEFQCLPNSLNWQQRKDILSTSATVYIEDLNPLLNYMFGVSVSDLGASSDIEWTNCTNTIDENGNKTPTITILVSIFASIFGISMILSVVVWWRDRWRQKSKPGNSSLRLFRAKPNTNPCFVDEDGHERVDGPNFEDVNEIRSSESSANSEESTYHKFQIQNSSTKPEEKVKISENSLSNGDSTEDADPHGGTSSSDSHNSTCDSSCDSSSDYHLKHNIPV